MVDISLPGLDGISVTRELVQRHPGLRAIMLTAYSGEDYVVRALSSGATGYALKAQPAGTEGDMVGDSNPGMMPMRLQNKINRKTVAK